MRIEKLPFPNARFDHADLSPDVVGMCYEFLRGPSQGKFFYGIHTDFGPMAQGPMNNLWPKNLP